MFVYSPGTKRRGRELFNLLSLSTLMKQGFLQESQRPAVPCKTRRRKRKKKRMGRGGGRREEWPPAVKSPLPSVIRPIKLGALLSGRSSKFNGVDIHYSEFLHTTIDVSCILSTEHSAATSRFHCTYHRKKEMSLALHCFSCTCRTETCAPAN